ncbi:L-amino acid N-acyltransferase YncA [Saccharopolyspora shandongensis]|uniref:L-amino acid N-acyltransferase YncA n=2 Tax=Saccharopolyspora shandongensis TaxID=418495 RepID=A0A1H3RIA6_9PSEU|nr:L-amino acid N-acyltransferase YncA [Saccharopolyspora shandongensis]
MRPDAVFARNRRPTHLRRLGGAGLPCRIRNSLYSLAFMADWELRDSSAADVEAVAELRAVVLRTDLQRLGRYDEQRVRQRLRDGFEPGHTWVIEVGGAFAGCVALRPAESACWLEHFYLAPDVQGRGIGSAVLGSLLERCDREGATVRLNVLQGSPARKLYERHGFAVETEDAVDVFMVRAPVSAAPGSGDPDLGVD